VVVVLVVVLQRLLQVQQTQVEEAVGHQTRAAELRARLVVQAS
jgi:hypothetical protein